MIGIYKITSPSGKIYVGQSINIEVRFRRYRNLQCKKQPRLYNSFLRHGVLSHIFEILEQCLPCFLNERERHYQDLYCSTNRRCLNLLLTGTLDKCGSHSKETKQKISKKNKGKIHSEISKQRMSASRTGIKNHFFNKRHSQEARNKIRQHRLGKKYSDEINKKKASPRELNPNAKLVLNLLNGIYYGCVVDAANTYCISERNLARKLRGERNNKTPFSYV